jgi:hypothetical protein
MNTNEYERHLLLRMLRDVAGILKAVDIAFDLCHQSAIGLQA